MTFQRNFEASHSSPGVGNPIAAVAAVGGSTATVVYTFRTAIRVYRFLRRALAMYNKYKSLISNVQAFTDMYSDDSEVKRFQVGEDVYLFLLARGICTQSKVGLNVGGADGAAWIIAGTIDQLHKHSVSQEPSARLSFFLYLLGQNLAMRSLVVAEQLHAYRNALTGPVSISDPLVESMNTAADKRFSATEEFILETLAGNSSVADLLDLAYVTSSVPGYGFIAAYGDLPGTDDDSYAYEKTLIENAGLIHKTALCMNDVLSGADAIVSSRPSFIAYKPAGPFGWSLAAPMSFSAPPETRSMRLRISNNNGITAEMRMSMSRLRTSAAGYQALSDSNEVVDSREVTIVKVPGTDADSPGSIKYVLSAPTEFDEGRSASTRMKEKLEAILLSKAKGTLKRSIIKGRKKYVAKADKEEDTSPNND